MAGEMFRAINDADGTDSGAPGLNNVNRMIIIVAETGQQGIRRGGQSGAPKAGNTQRSVPYMTAAKA